MERHTVTDSGGTVTDTRASSSVFNDAVPAGHRPLYEVFAFNVSNDAVLAVVELLATTTYSTWSLASIRLNA